MLDAFRETVQRIKDELLLWLLAMLLLAIIAGVRDRVTFIAVLVVGASLFSLRLLLARKEQGLPLNLAFPQDTVGEVNVLECRFELRAHDNSMKANGHLAFSFDLDSWVCFLPRNMATSDIIRIYLRDQAGQTWETGPFRPLFGKRDVRKSS